MAKEKHSPLELLKEIEWKAGFRPNGVCLYCFMPKEQGHSKNCRFAQAISLLEVQPEPTKLYKLKELARAMKNHIKECNTCVIKYQEIMREMV